MVESGNRVELGGIMALGGQKHTSGQQERQSVRHGDTDNPRSIRMRIVSDSLQVCPYLEGHVARMPLMVPAAGIDADQLDHLLANGYRRCGYYFYRTSCPSCEECVPVRVPIDQFRFRSWMKRIVNRAGRELEIRHGDVSGDDERLKLFNRHRIERRLGDSVATREDLSSFLVDSGVDSIEIQFRRAKQLIGVAIADLGRHSVNAVYTYFDPEFHRFSLGTLAVLELIRLAEQTQRRFVYLGLFVADCRHLNYKARFRPQERRLRGEWLRFDAAD